MAALRRSIMLFNVSASILFLAAIMSGIYINFTSKLRTCTQMPHYVNGAFTVRRTGPFPFFFFFGGGGHNNFFARISYPCRWGGGGGGCEEEEENHSFEAIGYRKPHREKGYPLPTVRDCLEIRY